MSLPTVLFQRIVARAQGTGHNLCFASISETLLGGDRGTANIHCLPVQRCALMKQGDRQQKRVVYHLILSLNAWLNESQHSGDGTQEFVFSCIHREAFQGQGDRSSFFTPKGTGNNGPLETVQCYFHTRTILCAPYAASVLVFNVL